MMKSVLIAIQPQWAEKIANGEKTIEVRKSAPKEVPFKAYIYCSQPNDIVLDTFMGSGTTAVACKNTGRNFIGFEINPKWVQVANDRLNNIDATGQISLLTF